MPRINAGITSKDVIGHLNQTITWYRRVAEVDQSSTAPENLLLQNNVHGTAKQVLKLAFDYARAQANLLSKTGPASAAQTLRRPPPSASCARTAFNRNWTSSTADRTCKARERPALGGGAESHVRQSGVGERCANCDQEYGFVCEAPRGLGSRALVRPDQRSRKSELRPSTRRTIRRRHPPKTTRMMPAQAFHPENAGIITLISKATTLASDRSELDSLEKGTDRLACRDRATARALANGPTQCSEPKRFPCHAADATTPDDWNARRKQIEALAARFKQLSSVLTPLGQQGDRFAAGPGGARGVAQRARPAISLHFAFSLRAVGKSGRRRLFLLLASALWQRAIFRYVHDPRRRRQFMVVKRIIVGLAMALILALGFLSSFSSVVTVLGSSPPALRSRCRSHFVGGRLFFLVGRYGLRAGDRVTVSGVPGK